MKIHEYQARDIFCRFGIPFPRSKVAYSPDEVSQIAKEFNTPVVVKAQVHVGGRGKAGGIKLANTPQEAKLVAQDILGMEIKGLKVEKVLVAEAIDIKSEAYIGITIDRKAKKPVIIVSGKGGVDIEEVARQSPEAIHKLHVDPLVGLLPYQARNLCFKIYDEAKLASRAAFVLLSLYKAFIESDASLAEINPFVIDKNNELWGCDAKILIDDNALFRHPDIEEMREVVGDEAKEVEAKAKGLSYIKLSGSIGCVVNGAGLAMSTMDLIKLYGGEPANFLDIGGSSSPEKVTSAMEILLSDKNVKVVFFNIFGGITRCDDVAMGIVESIKKMGVKLPIVIRLTGTNEDKAREILKQTDLIPAASMREGAKKAVEIASKSG
jgi:succinyl-CoA synthetase beta subunit